MPDPTYPTQLHFMCGSFFRRLLVAKVHRIYILLIRHVFLVLTIRLCAGVHSVVILVQTIVSGTGSLLLNFCLFVVLRGIIW